MFTHTDVLILLMDLASSHDISGQLHLVTGKKKAKEKEVINIREKCLEVGLEKSRSLIGLHAFSGADWGGKFAAVTKARWISNYLNLEPTSEIIYAFQKFGEIDFNVASVSNVLEKFVCSVYARNSKCSAVKGLRWELLKSKQLESEHLPPTLGALKPHIQRANIISRISKGYK